MAAMTPDPQKAEAMLDKAVLRFNSIFESALASGQLRPDASLNLGGLQIDPAIQRLIDIAVIALAAVALIGVKRGGNGFDGIEVRFNDEGVPVLPGTLARFECAEQAQHDAGDHTIIIGRVLRVAHRQGEPLCFSGGRFGRFAV